MKVYFLEVGILLDEPDAEYTSYSNVYDKKHGFFDEWQKYMPGFDEAVREAERYVQDGVENTYAVISEFETGCDCAEDMLDNLNLPNTGYTMEDVVFSVVKKGNCLVQNFLEQA